MKNSLGTARETTMRKFKLSKCQILTAALTLLLNIAPDICSARACTEMGCLDGTTIIISHPKWKPGAHLTLEIDGVSLATATCTKAQCTNSISLEGTPPKIMLKITATDKEVHSVVVEPQYKKVYPNGKGCPPTCRQGHAVVE